MNKKQYMINNEPASANDIINKAKEFDSNYGKSGIYQTSVAAKILRQNGYIVEINSDYKTDS